MKQYLTLISQALIVTFLLIAGANAQFIETRKVPMPQMGHDEWITQMLVSPSGKEIVSAGADGRVVIWNVADGKMVREISFSGIVVSMAVSKDGRNIAMGDAAGKVSVIDYDTGRIVNSFQADKEVVNSVAFSPDGQLLAAGGREGIVRIWTVADGKLTTELKPGKGDIAALAFADTQLLVGTLNLKANGYSVNLWDLQKNAVVRSFDEGAPALRGIAVSPDGKLLAISNYRPASLFTMLPGEGNQFEISLRVLPESDEPDLVGIWDLATGKRISGLDAETGARSIAFSPDGRSIAASGGNGAMIFDIADGTFNEIGRVDSRTGIDAVAFMPDSKRLAIARQRQPMVEYGGDNALDKLTNPFFVNMVMTIREGTAPTFKKGSGGQSITGGSNIELWELTRWDDPTGLKTWEAAKAAFSGKKEEAKRLFDQVIKEHPENARAGRLYAVFFESTDVEKAADRLEASVKADPTCAACLRSLGDLLHAAKQYKPAAAAYEKALQVKPEYGLVAAHLAATYAAIGMEFIMAGNSQKNLDAASDAMVHALMLRPADVEYISNEATIAYFEGDFDTTISLLLIAQRVRPDHGRIYYNLGHAYRQKGDKQHALESYRRYVAMGEKGEEARVEKAKQFISELSQ